MLGVVASIQAYSLQVPRITTDLRVFILLSSSSSAFSSASPHFTFYFNRTLLLPIFIPLITSFSNTPLLNKRHIPARSSTPKESPTPKVLTLLIFHRRQCPLFKLAPSIPGFSSFKPEKSPKKESRNPPPPRLQAPPSPQVRAQSPRLFAMSQSGQFPPSLRQTQVDSSFMSGGSGSASGSQHQTDELHMSGLSHTAGPVSMSPQDYDYAPQIKLDTASMNPSPQHPFQPASASSVPNVLQPAGGLSARGAPASPNLPSPMQQSSPAASSSSQHQHQNQPQPQHQQQLHHQSQQGQQQPQQPQQQHGYSSPSSAAGRPPLSMSHSYSRSSPAAGYDGSSSFHAYTPTTPGGPSHFMSSTEAKFNVPGSQRTISNTPLGLADIRPRADSTMSDGPGSLGYDPNSTQSSTSSYTAPWAIYAFDWCKWPTQGNGAGKLAVGSYLEDGHNFVRNMPPIHSPPT